MTKFPDNFVVGDTVTLSEHGTRHWYRGEVREAREGKGSNPYGISGIIIDINDDEDDNLPIAVLWDNGLSNNYSALDLEYFNLNLENK